MVHFRLGNIIKFGSAARIAREILAGHYMSLDGSQIADHEFHFKEFAFDHPDKESVLEHLKAIRGWLKGLVELKYVILSIFISINSNQIEGFNGL